jgi:hypothetical protein
MKKVVEVAEIKKKIEKLINSANEDFKKGFNNLYDLKIYVAKVMFSYLEDLICEPETWEEDMFHLNEWMDSLRH